VQSVVRSTSDKSFSAPFAPRLALGTRTRPIVSRLNISPGSSGVIVIEIVYDIYAISNSGPLRDAYGRLRIGAFSTISRRPFDRPRIVTQEKRFSEDYLRVHRFQWDRPLDDPNELMPNFNRYVIRAICSSNAKRSILPQTF
jgi:hypothetical protein